MMPLLWTLCPTESETGAKHWCQTRFWNCVWQVRCLCAISEISWWKASQHHLQKPEFSRRLVQVWLSNQVSLRLFRNRRRTTLWNNPIRFLLLLPRLPRLLLSPWLSRSLQAHRHRSQFPSPKRQQPSAAKAAPPATAAAAWREMPRGRSKFPRIVSLSKKQEKSISPAPGRFASSLKILKTWCFR